MEKINDKEIIAIAMKENRPELITQHKIFNKEMFLEKAIEKHDFKGGCAKLFIDEDSDTKIGCIDMECSKCEFNCSVKNNNTLATVIKWLKLDKQESIYDTEYNF